jgi:hydrogenase expression/formation protein HypE
MSKALFERLILPAFDNPALRTVHDGAVLAVPGGRLAFTTDSFVVRPLFFPGGDIGSLAVHGTVNDLAMCGARPVALSAAFILEEGFPLADLERVTRSMQGAAAAAGVPVVTGDTKVVDRGKGDGIYVNTAGVGVVLPAADVAPQRARPGDLVILSGEIAVHGIAILSVREGLAFETDLVSDSAALHRLVEAAIACGGAGVHVLRDPTRGGVASALNEIAEASRTGIVLEEAAIPVRDDVRGACEILGLDPLYVANEGKCLAIVAPDVADTVLGAMRSDPHGREARVVGTVTSDHPGQVRLKSRIGGWRVVDMMSGEQLPRIC